MKAPDWLPPDVKKEFNRIAKTVEVTEQNKAIVETLANSIVLYRQITSSIDGNYICEITNKPNPLLAVQQRYFANIQTAYKTLYGKQETKPVDSFDPLAKIKGDL